MARLLITCLFLAAIVLTVNPASSYAVKEGNTLDQDQERLELFQQMETLTGIPWYYLAAINQYEKNISKEKAGKQKPLISIHVPPEKWTGFLNPNPKETDEHIIHFFNGIGKDGSGDNMADPTNAHDVLFTMASFLSQYGYTEDDIRIGLWEYYNRDKAVDLISEYAQVYQTFKTLKLNEFAFPLPLHANYSYRSTWGAARGWGGRRIHEGCDLFAGYGTPVRSVAYGYIEVKGWNRFGGWRIGIRDLNNVYHYYAHLGGFKKSIRIGDVVKPGDIVGWVGSSGYGKPGTSGKFPPHLHYGMYRDNGKTEWAYDPFPQLKKWERDEWKRKTKRR